MAVTDAFDEMVEYAKKNPGKLAFGSSGSGTGPHLRYEMLRYVVVPLLTPAFLFGALWLAMLGFRELTIATMLFSPDNITLSVVVWSLWHSGNIAQAPTIQRPQMADM